MTARTLVWDGITISAAFGVILAGVGAVKLTLAAIGTLDGEAHPLLIATSWLHRLSEKIWPAKGRHHAAGLTDEDTPDGMLWLGEPQAWDDDKPHRWWERRKDARREDPGLYPEEWAPAQTLPPRMNVPRRRTSSVATGEPSQITDAPGNLAQAAPGHHGPGELDALDQLIEAARQHTVSDPQLLPAIRAALGFDSVDCYLDSMRRKLSLEVSA